MAGRFFVYVNIRVSVNIRVVGICNICVYVLFAYVYNLCMYKSAFTCCSYFCAGWLLVAL